MGLHSPLCRVHLALSLSSAALSCVTLVNLPMFSELYFPDLSMWTIISTLQSCGDKQMTTYFTR